MAKIQHLLYKLSFFVRVVIAIFLFDKWLDKVNEKYKFTIFDANRTEIHNIPLYYNYEYFTYIFIE